MIEVVKLDWLEGRGWFISTKFSPTILIIFVAIKLTLSHE